MSMKGIIAGVGVAWAVAAGAAVRFVSSKWHPDKRSLDDHLAPYDIERMRERKNG